MMKYLTVFLTLSLAVPAACAPSAAREPLLGGPCEDCHAVYVGMPDRIESRSRIASKDEPGEPLVIEGTVRDLEGKPAAGIIVYAHHTNAVGIYPRADTRHGRIRGWAKSDSSGFYRFETVRPGAYRTRGYLNTFTSTSWNRGAPCIGLEISTSMTIR